MIARGGPASAYPFFFSFFVGRLPFRASSVSVFGNARGALCLILILN